MTLLDRLVRLSVLWSESNDRSTSRLATIVANDGKLFERIAGGGSCTVSTYERFLDFLSLPDNWTRGAPDEAVALMQSVRASVMIEHDAEINVTAAAAETGKINEVSASQRERAA